MNEKKVFDYKILSGEQDEVVAAVKRDMAKGWHTYGGVSICKEGMYLIYSQAMVRCEGDR